MNPLRTITLVICIAFLTIGGCVTTKDLATPANAQIAAQFAASKAIQYAVSPKDKAEVANYLCAVAVGLRSLASNNGVPTPELVNATIKTYLKPGSKWISLANDLASAYLVVYPTLHGKPGDAWKYLEAIAVGCEEGAKPWIGYIGPPITKPGRTPWPGFTPKPPCPNCPAPSPVATSHPLETPPPGQRTPKPIGTPSFGTPDPLETPPNDGSRTPSPHP